MIIIWIIDNRSDFRIIMFLILKEKLNERVITIRDFSYYG